MTTSVPGRARVVIVGGGVIGTSIAYHLTRLGWSDVVLLERDVLTSGTTWHAAGLITSAGMVDETALFMSRYSRDLYERLEEETGLSTGFNPVGHISIATNVHRMEALRRESEFAHGFGVDHHEVSPAEIADLWPLLRTDDLVGGILVSDEGRADPVGVAMSLARGARTGGATIVEGVPALGVISKRGRVTGVVTGHGTIETEYVVNCAGMWARQFGALAGIDVPLQAAEHYYLITEPMQGVRRDLPVIEDPDCYGYFRPEGDGLLVGLFEPVAAPWSLDGVPTDSSFAELEPDYDRLAPFLGPAMARVPDLVDIGIRKFFCGPESFTSDVHPLLGPAPELDNYFVAAGLNSLGILFGGGVGTVMASWIVDGEPPVDVTGYAIDRTSPHESTRAFRRERTVEQLGVLFGDAVYPSWRPTTARNMRRSVLHDRFTAAGANFNSSVGWEFVEWFEGDAFPIEAKPGFRRAETFDLVAGEHRTVREQVGIMDMTLMAKFVVQGRDAAAVLSRLSANHVDREVGRVVYTQWLHPGGGIATDLTVTRVADERFLVVTSDLIQRRVEPMVRRATRPDEQCTVTEVTSGTVLLSVQGPASRELISRLSSADLSNAAFPYLSARTIDVGHARVLALRVTYLGELGYELHVPTEYGLGVYDALMEAGADLGVRPVGLAAMAGLRLEKGYRDLGVDIDNTDNPLEAGLGFAVAFDKPGGFIGREALLALRDTAPYRSLLVSLLVEDPDVDLFGNEPVLLGGSWIGYVRAAAYGHTVGGAVGLAMVEHPDGVTPEWLASMEFEVWTPRGNTPVRLSAAPLYDPARTRILAEEDA
jgi:glycine cleavage system aminomethyltransferase T/glycine/D-amino acid oxidase-like deaminating enzyme